MSQAHSERGYRNVLHLWGNLLWSFCISSKSLWLAPALPVALWTVATPASGQEGAVSLGVEPSPKQSEGTFSFLKSWKGTMLGFFLPGVTRKM